MRVTVPSPTQTRDIRIRCCGRTTARCRSCGPTACRLVCVLPDRPCAPFQESWQARRCSSSTPTVSRKRPAIWSRANGSAGSPLEAKRFFTLKIRPSSSRVSVFGTPRATTWPFCCLNFVNRSAGRSIRAIGALRDWCAVSFRSLSHRSRNREAITRARSSFSASLRQTSPNTPAARSKSHSTGTKASRCCTSSIAVKAT